MINIKDLVYKYSELEIWGLPDRWFTIVFEDGEFRANTAQIQYSWYYWEFFRQYPGIPLIKAILCPRYYDTSTHVKMGTFLIWYVYNAAKTMGLVQDIWDISKIFCEIGNDIHNAHCIFLGEYVTTGSVYDLIEIMDEPEIKEAKETYIREVEACNYSEYKVPKLINDVHKIISNVLFNRRDILTNNNVKKLCMMGLLNAGQMNQIIGPWGYVTDINDRPFPYPINTGYLEGLHTTYDILTESRTASVAMLMTKTPLEDSEYFSRRVQIAAMVVLNYVHIEGGCMGYKTIPHLVSSCDEKMLRGKYHMVSGKPVMINRDINHLVGTVIELRSITGCGHSNPQEICSVCLGWVTNIIPPNANLGYFICTRLNNIISQLMLSTKHYLESSQGKLLQLNAHSSKWFKVKTHNPHSVYLQDKYSNKTVSIRVENKYVKLLAQIMHTEVDELPISQLTCIPALSIIQLDDEGNDLGIPDVLTLEVSGTGVSLTNELLEYLKRNSWTVDKNCIEFKLTNWDTSIPVFSSPKKSDNITIFFNTLSGFIDDEKTGNSKISDFKTAGGALSELTRILRDKISTFNFIQVEILVKMLMCDINSPGGYKLPTSSDEYTFKGLPSTILNRSISGAAAYEDQHKVFGSNNKWYNKDVPMAHPFDALLK